MSLDLLISKYLDGELTREEDNSLRQFVKENSSAKKEFDAAVLLNAAFREDAESIETPADIAAQTEDLLLIRIMNAYDPPPIPSVIRTQRRYEFAPAMAFMLAVLMIGGVFSISDISDYNYEFSGFSQNETKVLTEEPAESNAKSSAVLSNDVKKSSTASSKRTKVSIAREAFATSISENSASEPEVFVSAEIVEAIELEQPNTANQSAVASVDQSIYDVPAAEPMLNNTRDEAITLSNANTMMDNRLAFNDHGANNNRFNQQFYYSMGALNSFDPFSNQSDVFLETFVGNDIAKPKRNFKNSKPITSYSQSVAYSVNESNKLGLEVGTTEYGYDFNTYLRVGGASAPSKIEGLNPIGNNDGSYYVPIKLNKQSQMYWVATFWDYDLLSGETVSMQSRLGAGVSGEGILFYGRIIGKAHLYKGLYLNIGTEARGFDAKLNTNKQGFIGTGSIIYGFQLKF